MHEPKQLSKRQLAVAEDLFAGELDEQKVLDKYVCRAAQAVCRGGPSSQRRARRV